MAPPANEGREEAHSSATGGMPHADEALKSLISRFESSPGDSFVALASALISRGHASEALRVAEHGLQHAPSSADGRIERAAALLALGRPRVAFVELRRALALNPKHRRALRLLGRAYKEAGAPGRAAELLAQRFSSSDTAPSTVAFPPAAPTVPNAPVPTEAASLNTDLFTSLTVDLGLSGPLPESSQKQVEMTQIIRRRGVPRPPRSASELAAIDGPIVDTTQSGPSVGADSPKVMSSEGSPNLSPMFDIGDDEPLFQEATPFEVRPVETSDLSLEGLEPGSETEVDTFDVERLAADLGDINALEELSTKETLIQPNPIRRGAPPAASIEPADTGPLSRAPAPDGPLELVPPPLRRSYLVLGVLGATAMLLYAAALALYSAEALEVWIDLGKLFGRSSGSFGEP